MSISHSQHEVSLTFVWDMVPLIWFLGIPCSGRAYEKQSAPPLSSVLDLASVSVKCLSNHFTSRVEGVACVSAVIRPVKCVTRSWCETISFGFCLLPQTLSACVATCGVCVIWGLLAAERDGDSLRAACPSFKAWSADMRGHLPATSTQLTQGVMHLDS